MSDKWRVERDAELERLTDKAYALLVDRTVVHVVALSHDDDCDATNRLRLTLDNAVVVDIDGAYGEYTGNSCDEYIELISIDQVP